ncbi:MAG: EAL domain-containing protein [Gemmatirosa sp.]|nr:EAL domain-containing protein [Gemmatirosa sp.]
MSVLITWLRDRVRLTSWVTSWDGAVVGVVGLATLALVPLVVGPGHGLVPAERLQQAGLGLQLALLAVIVRASAMPDAAPAVRRAWRRMALAFALLMGGDLLWGALGSPDLSIADVPNTAFYPVALWAVLSFPTERPRSRLRFWLDSGVIVLGVGTLVWYFVLAPTIASADAGESRVAAFVNTGYPVWDVVLLFGACAALLREPSGGRRALAWIAAAMVAQAAADLLYDVASLADAFQPGGYLDVVWLLAYWGVAMGAVSHRRELAARRTATGDAAGSSGTPDASRLRAAAWRHGREMLPYGAVVVAYVTLVVATRHAAAGGGALDLLGALTGTAAVTALVILRQVQAMRENARLAREAGIRESEYRVSILVRHSSDALLVVCRDGLVRFSSPAAEALFGGREDALDGRALAGVVAEDTADAVASFLETVRTEGTGRVIWRLRDAAEDVERYVEVVGTDLIDEPTVGGVVLNVRDVTDRTTLQNQLAFLAFHDPLTGLVNRTRFRDRVAASLAAAAALPLDDAPTPAVLFVDLDDFKIVNDSMGHAAGDRLLKVVAERLLSATRGCDTVARLGGDEFGVLLGGVRVERDAEVVAQRIVDSLRAPIALDEGEVYMHASIGVALATRRAECDVDLLLRNADTAMYHAKGNGKSRFALFAGGMETSAPLLLAVQTDLHHAIDREELFLEYQPIVELGTGALVGVEALVRWQHPQRGRVNPLEFIPVAEQTGLIVPIGRWVLREACRTAAGWCGTGAVSSSGRPFYVSVNIASRQLADPSIVADVVEALDDADLEPRHLLLEITESVIVSDAPHVHATLDALKALGVRLAIDDFGTGYSSLAYLQQFPIDVLKIDRAFVAGLGRGESQSALARAVIALGEALSLDTIAEGVETPAQQHALHTLGCRLAQGYKFSRPVPASALDDMLLAASVG